MAGSFKLASGAGVVANMASASGFWGGLNLTSSVLSSSSSGTMHDPTDIAIAIMIATSAVELIIQRQMKGTIFSVKH